MHDDDPLEVIWVDTWTHARAEYVIRETLLRNRRAGR
jgi:hypothetical protein